MMEKKTDYDMVLEYNKLRGKFALPEYKNLAEDFDIEKLSEKEETDFLLREIRRATGEKLAGYMHLFEILINPSSPPLFLFSVLKKINHSTKEKVDSLYKKLGEFQIESMKLDTIYSEENEARFIMKIFTEWQKLKKEIYGIIETFELNIREKEDERKGGYFG